MPDPHWEKLQQIFHAAIAISPQRDRADQAIEFLNAAVPHERGNAAFWPDYLRGQTYLALRRGNEAAAEFQKSSITEDGIRLRRCIRLRISALRELLC
jgi:predicted negative regulator of RcsB-dependent stress response